MPEGRVGILIPAYRAGSSVAGVVGRLRALHPDLPVLVVDDGSDDDTATAAREAGACVLVQPVNGGKGTSLSAGLSEAAARGWTWALAMDSDGQHSPSDVERFLSHMPASRCAVVVGARDLRPRSMPWPRVFSNLATTMLLEWQAGCRLWDSQCGFRMYRVDAVRATRLPTTGRFEWESGALVRLALAGWKVEHVGISTVYGEAGSHIRPWRDTARFVRLWLGLWGLMLRDRSPSDAGTANLRDCIFLKPHQTSRRRDSMAYQKIQVPTGEKITKSPTGALQVPDRPVVPFIEGDGTGRDIWRASVRVLDAAVAKAYGGKKKISWMEVFAGEKANTVYGPGTWLPDETVEAFKEYLVGIKGPLTTPVGGGIRSLNVALRQMLDLYVCLRPVKYYTGTPSPVKHPEKVDMVIFRENTEDIYAGIEWAAGTPEAAKILEFVSREFPKSFDKIRFNSEAKNRDFWGSIGMADHFDESVQVGIGIKPVSKTGTFRLVHDAIDYAIREGKKSVTLVHKGNIMKFTEGAFRDWGYEIARTAFGAELVDGGPWCRIPEGKRGAGLVIKDSIADITLQQVLTRPEDFDVIATLNLNGDYLSDALAAQVGGIGIAPGGNINYVTGHAIFEATHGTAPKYADKDQVNPGSVVLSGEMMLRYLGWTEAADLVNKGLSGAIHSKRVTYDFARQMDGATQVKCSEFGDNIIAHM